MSRVFFLRPVEPVCPLSRGNFHSFFTQSWYNIGVRQIFPVVVRLVAVVAVRSSDAEGKYLVKSFFTKSLKKIKYPTKCAGMNML